MWHAVKGVPQLAAVADNELREHLAQVPFHGARAKDQARPDLCVRLTRPLPSARSAAPGRSAPRVRPRCAFSHHLPGGEQLTTGSFGEALEGHRREHRVRGAQLLARRGPRSGAPQPFAVQQVCCRASSRECWCGRTGRWRLRTTLRPHHRPPTAPWTSLRGRVPSRCPPHASSTQGGPGPARRLRAGRSGQPPRPSRRAPRSCRQARRGVPGPPVPRPAPGRSGRGRCRARPGPTRCASARDPRPGYRLGDGLVDQPDRLCLVATVSGEGDGDAGRGVGPDRIGDDLNFRDHRGRSVEITRIEPDTVEPGKGIRQDGERAEVTSELHVTSRELGHRLVVPQLRRDMAGDPPPAELLFRTGGAAPESTHGSL